MDDVTPPSLAESPTARPLLPAVMTDPAGFLWFWVLPSLVLLALNLQSYHLIQGDMSPAQQTLAWQLGGIAIANLVAGLVLFRVTLGWTRTGRIDAARHAAWGVPGVLLHTVYLWFAVAHGDELLPATVTQWIYPPERYLFHQFSFLMLPLFHGILRIAGAKVTAGAGRAIAVSAGVAVACPVLLYLVLSSLRFLDGRSGGSWIIVFIASLVVVLGILMFIALVRGVLLVLRFVSRWHTTGERWAIVFIALGLPTGGLLLNRSIPFPVDFQALEVYVLTVVNAFVLLFASWQAARWPRVSWALLWVSFPFSLYFFIVFLPYTPLSILAIIAVGTGLLVLTPTLLFALHLHLLVRAWRNGGLGGARTQAFALALAAVAVLPTFFTVRGLADKAALNAALDHVHAPALHRPQLVYAANLGNLERALGSHHRYKDGIYYPLLSDYYAWLVFDNLVLPDDKLRRLDEVFLGRRPGATDDDPYRHSIWGRSDVRHRHRMPRAVATPQTVAIQQLTTRAERVDAQNTRVTLGLTLANTGKLPAEYVKTLPLPAGIFVTGFRLQINGEAVPGRIFERKTALWVYTMIRDSERRDPGLLLYREPHELELRVFPVAPDKPSKVEIDLLVPAALGESWNAETKDPAELMAKLGGARPVLLTRDGSNQPVVVSAESAKLPTVPREPYLHFIVDRSRENGFDGKLSDLLPALQKRFPGARQARLTLANYEVVSPVSALRPVSEVVSLRPDEMQRLAPCAGGCVLDLAVAHALRQHLEMDLDGGSGEAIPARPIIVYVSRAGAEKSPAWEFAQAWGDGTEDWEMWSATATGVSAMPWREATEHVLLRIGASQRPLLSGGTMRFARRGEGDRLQYWDPVARDWSQVPGVVEQGAASPWRQAVALHAQQQDEARSPGDAAVDLKALVQASRTSGLLLPSTSYIVVENDAQWRMLEKAEKQKLGQNAALDFLETPAPPAWWLVLGVGAWFAARRFWRVSRGRGPACAVLDCDGGFGQRTAQARPLPILVSD